MDLLNAFNDLDRHDEPKNRDKVLRAPFAYPGGKSRSIQQILPLLPYTDVYVEPFGGSAAVLLARQPSKLEVFNDRYSGVVAFYRCIRNRDKLERLIERLEFTLHAREEFVYCKFNWEKTEDDVERAALWFTMMTHSFASLGRNFGRSTTSKSPMAKKLATRLARFPLIHERFSNVQVENQDWYDCMKDYDQPNAVFYCDPPYVDAYRGTFKHEMTIEEHRHFLDFIFNCEGFVAVSGYSNPLYDEQPWDDRHDWDSFVSISPRAFTDSNFKKDLKHQDERKHAKEVLWVKEAR